MARTNSLAWPTMFDVSRNKVSTVSDNTSIVSRVRLLMLSDPTELYNNPTFGVGLKRYLWQYNTTNTRARIQDRIVECIGEHEPCVVAEQTKFADSLLFTQSNEVPVQEFNKLKMTVGLQTIYGDEVSVELNSSDLQIRIDAGQKLYGSGGNQ